MIRKILLVIIAGLFILGIGKIVLAMSCGDHNSSQQLVASPNGNEPAAINVGNKICPVSGEKIGEGNSVDAATFEYQGKIYNFCCAACIEEFKQNPDKYIKIVEKELQK